MENKDFAERNVGLVRALVPRFLGRGIEYDDLFQAGCEGLIKAAAHFDPDRGYKFSTYAVPVILGEMRRLFREGGTVKVSRGLKELSMKAVHLSEQIETETGKAPSVSVLAEKLGVPEEKCAEALNAARFPHRRRRKQRDGHSRRRTGRKNHRSPRLAANTKGAARGGPAPYLLSLF